MEDGCADLSPCIFATTHFPTERNQFYLLETSRPPIWQLYSYLPVTPRPMKWRTLPQCPLPEWQELWPDLKKEESLWTSAGQKFRTWSLLFVWGVKKGSIPPRPFLECVKNGFLSLVQTRVLKWGQTHTRDPLTHFGGGVHSSQKGPCDGRCPS